MSSASTTFINCLFKYLQLGCSLFGCLGNAILCYTDNYFIHVVKLIIHFPYIYAIYRCFRKIFSYLKCIFLYFVLSVLDRFWNISVYNPSRINCVLFSFNLLFYYFLLFFSTCLHFFSPHFLCPLKPSSHLLGYLLSNQKFPCLSIYFFLNCWCLYFLLQIMIVNV